MSRLHFENNYKSYLFITIFMGLKVFHLLTATYGAKTICRHDDATMISSTVLGTLIFASSASSYDEVEMLRI